MLFRSYPYLITNEWAPPHRSDRIENLVGLRARHNTESFRSIQGDVTSLAVRDLLPLLLAAPAGSVETSAILRQLSSWNGEMSSDRAEPLVVAAWIRELTRLIYSDELGPELFKDAWDQRAIFVRNVLLDRNGQGRWCDDISTPQRETCADMIGRALPLALADLKLRYGADMSKWRWGDAHPAVSDHRPLGRQPWLREWFNISVPTAGDNYTVNVGSFRIGNDAAPYVSRHAASLRAIYDLADLNRSVYMPSTGQSGNLLSPYYSNFSAPWARLESIPMTTNRTEIEVGAIGVLNLVSGR